VAADAFHADKNGAFHSGGNIFFAATNGPF
jgi:hypothetical protein